ncbi:hypothetical protein PENSUB_304 [Penicillium subrubescens]|jgi:hypothetical protein|uniref:Uncharacterized protein n=1 Tax=Penicillium subrubescens TaxID=1316194 RepID=A0A1Q5UNJ0_9EURO|nr:hypothetical protein PENSUB_304 [Penicillium subrubescens]
MLARFSIVKFGKDFFRSASQRNQAHLNSWTNEAFAQRSGHFVLEKHAKGNMIGLPGDLDPKYHEPKVPSLVASTM